MSSQIEHILNNQKPISISKFFDLVNDGLSTYTVQIVGEITTIQTRGNAMYFTLKDGEDGAAEGGSPGQYGQTQSSSSMSCFMWTRDFKSCAAVIGDKLEAGMKVTIYGIPQIYKPSGRLNFQVKLIQMVGEGALKKAYDLLKEKLQREGIFDQERKKMIPDLVKKIGVITSKNGAVIHDFLNNLGKYGFETSLYDVHVEGLYALNDVQKALKYFANSDVDVVVLIRGGGSLESFAAFNTESLVRTLINYPKPLIAGLGHDQDIPLVALVADMMTSTPTAITAHLNRTWQELFQSINVYEERLLRLLSSLRNELQQSINYFEKQLISGLQLIKEKTTHVYHSFTLSIQKFKNILYDQRQLLLLYESKLQAYDPERILSQGYALLRQNGELVKKGKDIDKDSVINITLEFDEIEAKVINIKPIKNK